MSINLKELVEESEFLEERDKLLENTKEASDPVMKTLGAILRTVIKMEDQLGLLYDEAEAKMRKDQQ